MPDANRDYEPNNYTNGELRALIGPIFGLNHENIASIIITISTTDGYVTTHGTASNCDNPHHDSYQHIQLLTGGILGISADMLDEIHGSDHS